MLVMRAARTIALAIALLAAQSAAAAAQDKVARAGPIEVRRSACLIAKLNPRLGLPCEVPAVSEAADPAQRAAARLKRASHFLDLNDFGRARSEIDAGLQAAPDDFELRLLSARLAMSAVDIRTTDPKIADRDIRIAMRLKPLDPDARATYAEFLRGNASPEEVLREFSAILKRDPAHDYSRLARAKLWQESGRHQDAVDDLDVFLARHETSSNGHILRGASYVALNRPSEAVADFTKALALAPNDIIALTGRATAYEMAGEPEKALADYDAILGPVGGRPNYALGGDRLGKYWQQRALLLARLKRFDDAATDMVSALMTGKTSVLRAQVFLRQNGFPELPLNGRDSPELRSALRTCFGLQPCFQGMMRAI
jgi:Tfp pilus assembly protein PilF